MAFSSNHSSSNSSFSNFTPGWNDPPQSYSSDRPKQNKTILNKRVAFPVSTGGLGGIPPNNSFPSGTHNQFASYAGSASALNASSNGSGMSGSPAAVDGVPPLLSAHSMPYGVPVIGGGRPSGFLGPPAVGSGVFHASGVAAPPSSSYASGGGSTESIPAQQQLQNVFNASYNAGQAQTLNAHQRHLSNAVLGQHSYSAPVLHPAHLNHPAESPFFPAATAVPAQTTTPLDATMTPTTMPMTNSNSASSYSGYVFAIDQQLPPQQQPPMVLSAEDILAPFAALLTSFCASFGVELSADIQAKLEYLRGLLLHNSLSTPCREQLACAASAVKPAASQDDQSPLFDAIRQLHRQIDNDQSGIIDLQESSSFIKKELNLRENDQSHAQEKFHENNDYEITVNDLWDRWQNAQERRWSIEEVVQWLTESVQLPDYASRFRQNQINGEILPRLAVDSKFIVSVLGVQNPFHRQKLQLKATDAVLFGYKLQVSPLVAEQFNDAAGYEAIKQLHRQMDDDQSGVVDITESKDFLDEELSTLSGPNGNDRRHKQEKFHRNDSEITVDELWAKWVNSPERNWTTSELVQWLCDSVGLPEYAQRIINAQLTGKALPRLAVQTQFLIQLGIRQNVHRRKLQLKAMDAVLFGYNSGPTSYLKDVFLLALLGLAVCGFWFTASKNKKAQMELKTLASHMEYLKKVEEEFSGLQKTLQTEHANETQSVGEMEELKRRLNEAESLLDQKHMEMGCAPLALQGLLRRTYEAEVAAISHQKMESLKELRDAREMIEKLRKKQSSFITQFRVAQLGTDDVDKRIFEIRQKLEATVLAMQECQQRWAQIESLRGFSIMPTSPSSIASAPVMGLALSTLATAESPSSSFQHSGSADSMPRNANSFSSLPHALLSSAQRHSEPEFSNRAIASARGQLVKQHTSPSPPGGVPHSKTVNGTLPQARPVIFELENVNPLATTNGHRGSGGNLSGEGSESEGQGRTCEPRQSLSSPTGPTSPLSIKQRFSALTNSSSIPRSSSLSFGTPSSNGSLHSPTQEEVQNTPGVTSSKKKPTASKFFGGILNVGGGKKVN